MQSSRQGASRGANNTACKELTLFDVKCEKRQLQKQLDVLMSRINYFQRYQNYANRKNITNLFYSQRKIKARVISAEVRSSVEGVRNLHISAAKVKRAQVIQARKESQDKRYAAASLKYYQNTVATREVKGMLVSVHLAIADEATRANKQLVSRIDSAKKDRLIGILRRNVRKRMQLAYYKKMASEEAVRLQAQNKAKEKRLRQLQIQTQHQLYSIVNKAKSQ